MGWANAAIGLSRGGAAKTYRHTDLNEDACAFATGPEGTLLAVADGHWGSEASQAAITRLLEHHAPRLLEPRHGEAEASWESTVQELLVDLQGQILRVGKYRAPRSARTTFCLALALPGRDQLHWLNVGDSLLFAVGDGTVRELGPAPEAVGFLGTPADDAKRLLAHARRGSESLENLRALVLATDGLSEAGIGVADPAACAEAAVRAAARPEDPELSALETVRSVLDTGLTAHRTQKAGDNLAVAVGWLSER